MTALHNLGAEARRLRERLLELKAYSDSLRLQTQSLRFGASPLELGTEVQPGKSWPRWLRPAWFEATFEVPSDWPSTVELWADLGGEGCWIEQKEARFGFNPMHRHCEVSVRPGETCEFLFEVVPHGYQGAPIHEPKVNFCQLVVPDPEVRALVRELEVALGVLEFVASQDDREVGVRLLKSIEHALRELRLPREPSAAFLSRLSWLEATPADGGSTDSPALQVRSTLWERPVFDAKPTVLTQEHYVQIKNALARFQQARRELAKRYPGRGHLVAVGHAHLDVAWLWPLSETRKKSRRTFATACALADRYDDYVFGQSQAYLYAAVEEDDPQLFSRIQEHVKRGQIELLGGSWVEPDGNLASGESTVRQLLYGQRYFEQRFGRRCTTAWLPDTFGYAANLPQLYASAGMRQFMTTKLGWNETNKFPHDLYWWEALDGTRVLAHTFKELGPGPEPQLMSDAWAGFGGKERANVALQTYGRGDGGGGPSEEMIEGFRCLGEQPALPKISLGTVKSVFEQLVDCEDIPVWRGEKYLEKHRGTFTTQVTIKRDVQLLGEALRAAEFLSSLAYAEHNEPYPHEQLEHLWKELLVHEFHDILPGSSIHTVNVESTERLAAALGQTRDLQEQAAKSLHDEDKHSWTVWNLGEAPMPLCGALPVADKEVNSLSVEGKPLRTQRIDGELFFSGKDTLAPGSALVLQPSAVGERADGAQGEDEQGEGVQATTSSLRSSVVAAEFSPQGTLRSLRSVTTGQEFVREGAGRLVLHEDVPREYEAWDIDLTDLTHGETLTAVAEPSVLYEGPVEAAVAFELRGPGVEVTLTYRLRQDRPQLRIGAKVTWNCRRRLLRLELPTTVTSEAARFDTLFGSVSRPTSANTSWDAAKYEVPAHRGVTLEDAAHGIQLIAPYGRHGFSVNGSKIALSLLRAPIHPDPMADEGEHFFDCAIEVFDQSPVPAPVRQKLVCFSGRPRLPCATAKGWIAHEGVRCSALKKAEDSDALVLRLYEAEGVTRDAEITVPRWAKRVECCSILEDVEDSLNIIERGGMRFVIVPFAPYSVRTLAFFTEPNSPN